MCVKILFSLPYLAIMVGSIGMIIYQIKFPFSSNIDDLKLSPERFLCLNGKQVWHLSWGLIIAGTIGQLIAFWVFYKVAI